MKRVTLISAGLVLAFAGCSCGHGWRPHIFTRLHNCIHGVSNVGAPCEAGGCEAAPACETCGNETAHYGGYEGTVIGSYEGTPVSTYATTPGTTYGTPSTPATARYGSEIVSPKPAN